MTNINKINIEWTVSKEIDRIHKKTYYLRLPKKKRRLRNGDMAWTAGISRHGMMTEDYRVEYEEYQVQQWSEEVYGFNKADS